MAKKTQSQQAKGRCRIIAGDLRGRIIHFHDAEGLRPTTDRVRETLFNWLQPYLAGRACLDAFAGSGALGFEALSRGARHVTMIDSQQQAVADCRQNASALLGEHTQEAHTQESHIEIVHADVISWMQQQAGTSASFDLVFLDPPYHTGLLEKSVSSLHGSGCLAEDAIIYVEHAVDDKPVLPDSWTLFKGSKTAAIVYGLYLYSPS